MTIQIQPEEGVTLRFSATSGPNVPMDGVAMAFNYREHFHAARLPATKPSSMIDCGGAQRYSNAPITSKPDGVWCSPFSMPGSTIARPIFRSIRQEVRAPSKPRSS